MLMYQTKATLADVQTILVSVYPSWLISPQPQWKQTRRQTVPKRLPQNTEEKFGSAPEDCDQKEMYKLLVSAVMCKLQCTPLTHVV